MSLWSCSGALECLRPWKDEQQKPQDPGNGTHRCLAVAHQGQLQDAALGSLCWQLQIHLPSLWQLLRFLGTELDLAFWAPDQAYRGYSCRRGLLI